MGYTEKIDVLDMIIDVLRDHEKVLDNLVDRLEKIVIVGERRSMR